MNLHLRVLHGTLKRQDGKSLGSDIAVHGQRFTIGSGSECNMRCPSSTISEHHCEFVSEPNGIFVRDLQSESGTFLNGERLTTKRPLNHGDHLRVGKLEFEVVLSAPAAAVSETKTEESPAAVDSPPAKQPAAAGSPAAGDPIGDRISELLAAADEEERARQIHDPASRQFKPPGDDKPLASEEKDEKKKLVRPPKKPPGKLPPAPKIVADSSVNAAEEVLKKFFDKPKKRES